MSTKRFNASDLEDHKQNVQAVVGAAVSALLANVTRRLTEQTVLATSIGMAEDAVRTLNTQILMELSAQVASLGYQEGNQLGVRDFVPKLLDGLQKVFGDQFEISYTRKET